MGFKWEDTLQRYGFAAAKVAKRGIEKRVLECSLAMQKYDKAKRASGLLPDAVKASPEWKRDYAEYTTAFKELRDFNAAYVRKFHKEIRADYRRRKVASI